MVRKVSKAEVSGGGGTGGWISVKMALGGRGMTVEAACQFAGHRKE